jgi:hypothetical protein
MTSFDSKSRKNLKEVLELSERRQTLNEVLLIKNLPIQFACIVGHLISSTGELVKNKIPILMIPTSTIVYTQNFQM